MQGCQYLVLLSFLKHVLAGEGARSRELPIWAAAQQLQDGGGEQQAHAQLVQLAHCCWCH